MSEQQTVRVPAFMVLTVTADGHSAGSVVRINDSGSLGTPTPVAQSGSAVIAAAVYDRTYRVDSLNGALAYALTNSELPAAPTKSAVLALLELSGWDVDVASHKITLTLLNGEALELGPFATP